MGRKSYRPYKSKAEGSNESYHKASPRGKPTLMTEARLSKLNDIDDYILDLEREPDPTKQTVDEGKNFFASRA